MVDYLALVASKLGVGKMVALFGAKFLYLTKLGLALVLVFSTASFLGFPVHDIWFDYVLFIAISAFVAGEPEPDSQLAGLKFVYTWFYRSSHLLVGSATAYFLHHKSWAAIDGDKEK